MSGSSNISGDESIIFADNASFDGTERGGKLTTNGQLWIGSTASRHVKTGSIISPSGTVSIGYSSPNITLDVSAIVDQSLTPDTGGAVSSSAGTIPTLGYKAGTVPTIQTYNDGAGNFRIADQTWFTQYVVDPSSTAGLKGTFQTVQAAITQAVSDGASLTNEKMVFIRHGTYTENLTIPPGIFLKGEGLFYYPNTTYYQTIVSGHHSMTGTNISRFDGINFINNDGSADLFSNSGATLFNCNRCIFNNGASTGLIFTLNLSNSQFYSCLMVPAGTATTSFSIAGSSVASFTHCDFGEAVIHTGTDSSDCTLNLQDCLNVGVVNLGTAGSIITDYNSTFFTTTASITGSGGGNLYNSNFLNGSALASCIKSTGTFTVAGCSNNDAGSAGLYNSSPTINAGSSVSGNVIPRRATATSGNVTLNDYYVGVTDTSSARTLTITSLYKDRIWIFKDESGAAGTNNITISAGGVVTIDGSTTAVINVNYGSLTLLCNGTSFFII